MEQESYERVVSQRNSLKKMMEEVYRITIGNEHRWNCGWKFQMPCECEMAKVREQYEEFLWMEEIFQEENGIKNGMDTNRH